MFFKRVLLTFCFSVILSGAAAAQPKVVVSLAPFHSVVSFVMQGVGTPELLLNPAVSVHDYHLRPSDMRRLSSADILFWGGESLETFLQKPIQATGLSAKNVSFLSDPRLTKYFVRTDSMKKTLDPHFWLMPENMAVLALLCAEKLSELDPDHADIYQKNALLFQQRMKELKQKGENLFRSFDKKAYVTLHDAYQYFEKSFGLTPVGVVFVDAHHAAGAGHISFLRQKMKQSGKLCLFSEPQFSDKRLSVVSEDMDIVKGVLDPIGAGLTPGAAFYQELMNGLFNAFAECFSELSQKGEG